MGDGVVTAADWEIWQLPTAGGGTEPPSRMPTPESLAVTTEWDGPGSCQIRWPAGTWDHRQSWLPDEIYVGLPVIVYRSGVQAWSGLLTRFSMDWETGTVAASGVGIRAILDRNVSRVDLDITNDRGWIATELVVRGMYPRTDLNPPTITVDRGWTATSSARCIVAAHSQTLGAALSDWIRQDGNMVCTVDWTLDRQTRAIRCACAVWDARSGTSINWRNAVEWQIGPGAGMLGAARNLDLAARIPVLTVYPAGGSGVPPLDIDQSNGGLYWWQVASFENAWDATHLAHLADGILMQGRVVGSATTVTVDPAISGTPHPIHGWPRLGDDVRLPDWSTLQIRAIRWQVSQAGEALQWEIG